MKPATSRVVLSGRAAFDIYLAAAMGYEAPYKEERIGVLLGSVRGGTAHVEAARPYRAARRTRTSVSVDPLSMARAIDRLIARHRRAYLGIYHTHPEVASGFTLSLSQEDKRPICPFCEQTIEIVATIWASNGEAGKSKYYLQGKVGDYKIRMAAYRFGEVFRILPLFGKGIMSPAAFRRPATGQKRHPPAL